MADYSIVTNIVKNHFSLGEEGFSSFMKNLYSTAPEFAFLLENEENRVIKEIPEDIYYLIDDGFTIINKLNTFIDYNPLSYKDYLNNKVMVKGNYTKLFKAILNFYHAPVNGIYDSHHFERTIPDIRTAEMVIESCIAREIYKLYKTLYKREEVSQMKNNFFITYEPSDKKDFSYEFLFFILTKIFEKIGSYKLPNNKKLYFVMSINYNDFFLCSTSESWTSCLNPESKSGFWSSLPFLVSDKNRMICFVSDLSEKEYLGIKSLKMLKRGWGLINSDGTINTGKFYPAKEKISNEFYNKLGIDNFHNISCEFISKYPLNLFYNKYGIFDFVYQDDTAFSIEEESNEVYLVRGEKNHTIITDKLMFKEYHMTSYKDGLNSLITKNDSIENYPGLYFCKFCYSILDEKPKVVYNLISGEEEKSCIDCFHKNIKLKKVLCNQCGEQIIDNNYIIKNSKVFCSSCVTCDICDAPINKGESNLYMGKHTLCNKCFERKTTNRLENMLTSLKSKIS